MILVLSLVIAFGSLLLLIGILLLCVIGWKRKSDQATKSANYNAGLWAESEAKNAEFLLENVRLATLVKIYERHYQDVKSLAHKAIRVGAEREGLDPDEVLNIIPGETKGYYKSDDSILSADHVE